MFLLQYEIVELILKLVFYLSLYNTQLHEEITPPTTKPTSSIKYISLKKLSESPSPKKSICISAGNIHLQTKHETATKAMKSSYLCLKLLELDFFSIITFNFNKQVPIIEIIIPTPAIAIGNRIGPIPPNASSNTSHIFNNIVT